MKECIKCNSRKALEDFYTCYGMPRGECKDCFKVYVKQSTKLRRNVEKLTSDPRPAIYLKEYYQKNKEKYREYSRQFKMRNPHYFKDYYRQRKEIPAKNVA